MSDETERLRTEGAAQDGVVAPARPGLGAPFWVGATIALMAAAFLVLFTVAAPESSAGASPSPSVSPTARRSARGSRRRRTPARRR